MRNDHMRFSSSARFQVSTTRSLYLHVIWRLEVTKQSIPTPALHHPLLLCPAFHSDHFPLNRLCSRIRALLLIVPYWRSCDHFSTLSTLHRFGLQLSRITTGATYRIISGHSRAISIRVALLFSTIELLVFCWQRVSFDRKSCVWARRVT